MNTESLSRKIDKFRYLTIVAVVASGLGAALMLLIGAVKIVKAWVAFVPGGFLFGGGKGEAANSAIAYVAQGIDCFLIALVLLIFASGIFHLFIQQKPLGEKAGPGMFEIRDIGQLKSILGELVVIILFVKFLEVSLNNKDALTSEMLVLPGGALLLAAALKLLSLKEHSTRKD